jgi:ppGpp synthetase/RelA/SpoT-type nucleotidyltranferase
VDDATIRKQYDERHEGFRRLCDEVVFAVTEVLKSNSIKVHIVSSRVKSLQSLTEKAKRKESENPFESIHDLVGIRIICLFRSDIIRVGEALRALFEIEEEDDKVHGLQTSSFDYMSVHFLAKLGKQFSGPRYSGITDNLFEIQVRTLAMDAWASISHYIDYKTDVDVPESLRRDLFALNALFYLADSHFELFVKARETTRARISEEVNEVRGIADLPINLDTVTAYLRLRLPRRRQSDEKSVSSLVSDIVEADLESLGQLDALLKKSLKAVEAFEADRPPMKRLVKGKKHGSEVKTVKYTAVGVVRIALRLTNDKISQKYHAPHDFAKYKAMISL